MNGCMDGWIDEWMNEWMGGWMDGWIGGWKSGWVDQWSIDDVIIIIVPVIITTTIIIIILVITMTSPSWQLSSSLMWFAFLMKCFCIWTTNCLSPSPIHALVCTRLNGVVCTCERISVASVAGRRCRRRRRRRYCSIFD